MLTPHDVTQPTNATAPEPCSEPHTAQTYAVVSLPTPFAHAAYDDADVAAYAYRTCTQQFRDFTGADESLSMRTILSWAWFRPSEKAWKDGARWFRCDVIGGGAQSSTYLDLPPTTRDLLAGRPKDAWLVCARGATVDGSEKVPCAEKHTWRAVTTIVLGDRLGPLPRRPGRAGAYQGLLLQVGRGLARLPRRLRLRLLVVQGAGVERRQPSVGVLGEDRLVRALVAGLAVALLTAGCSGSTSSSSDAGPTPLLSSPTTTSASPQPKPDPPPPERACYRLAYDDALAPTIRKKPVPCTERHNAVNFYVGRYDEDLAVDGATLHRIVSTACPKRFATFAGGSLEDRRLSLLRTVWFTPTVEQAALGARWYSCVALAIRDSRTLAVLTERVAGALDSADGRAHYGLCGTAEPGSAGFQQRICSAPHSWRSLRTVPFAPATTPASPRSVPPARRSARTPAAPSPPTRSATAGPTSGPPSPSGAAARPTASAGPPADRVAAESAQRGSVFAPSRRKQAASSRRVVTSRLGERSLGQKPSLRSCLGSRCQSLAIFTCRSR